MKRFALNAAGTLSIIAACKMPLAYAWGKHDGPPWLQALDGEPLKLACVLLGTVLFSIAMACFIVASSPD